MTVPPSNITHSSNASHGNVSSSRPAAAAPPPRESSGPPSPPVSPHRIVLRSTTFVIDVDDTAATSVAELRLEALELMMRSTGGRVVSGPSPSELALSDEATGAAILSNRDLDRLAPGPLRVVATFVIPPPEDGEEGMRAPSPTRPAPRTEACRGGRAASPEGMTLSPAAKLQLPQRQRDSPPRGVTAALRDADDIEQRQGRVEAESPAIPARMSNPVPSPTHYGRSSPTRPSSYRDAAAGDSNIFTSAIRNGSASPQASHSPVHHSPIAGSVGACLIRVTDDHTQQHVDLSLAVGHPPLLEDVALRALRALRQPLSDSEAAVLVRDVALSFQRSMPPMVSSRYVPPRCVMRSDGDVDALIWEALGLAGRGDDGPFHVRMVVRDPLPL